MAKTQVSTKKKLTKKRKKDKKNPYICHDEFDWEWICE